MQPTYRLQRDPGTHGVPIFRPLVGKIRLTRAYGKYTTPLLKAPGVVLSQVGLMDLARRSATRKGTLGWASCIVMPSKGRIR